MSPPPSARASQHSRPVRRKPWFQAAKKCRQFPQRSWSVGWRDVRCWFVHGRTFSSRLRISRISQPPARLRESRCIAIIKFVRHAESLHLLPPKLACAIHPSGQVAQLVERSPEKAGVGGSISSLATIFVNLLSISYWRFTAIVQ